MEDDNPWGVEPHWLRLENEGESDVLGGDDDDDDSPYGAQHVMILVDCQPSMLQPCIAVSNLDGQNPVSSSTISPMDAAILACERLLRLKVLHVATSKAGKRDGIGIMLYGSRKLQDSNDDEDEDDNVTDTLRSDLSLTQTLISLEPPGIPQLKTILECVFDHRYGGKQRELQMEYETEEDSSGHASVSLLRTAIHEAIKAFANAKCVKKQKGRQDAKTLWIFTNDDDPGNDEEKKHIVMVANDAIENGINLHLWPLPRQDSTAVFRTDLFFSKIVTRHLEPSASATFDLADLMDQIYQEWKRPRKASSLPMLLPDWREHPNHPGIMVDLYRPVQIQKKPYPVTINQQTNKATERVTQLVNVDTAEILQTSRDTTRDPQSGSAPSMDRILHFTNFGGERVYITKAEVSQIKRYSNANQEAACLILSGFKDVNSIPIHHTLERSHFIYPNEDKVTGSTDAFANLHAAMIRKKVLAIGELLLRVTATSRLVAIYPQQEAVCIDEDGVSFRQVTPPGMVLINLPFEDDIRSLGPDAGTDASEESVLAAMELIRHQRIENVELGVDFENKALKQFWNYIESVALETTLASQEEHDTDILDEAYVLEAAGEQIDAFRNSCPDDVKIVKARKRAIVADESGCDWEHLYKSDALSDCTVETLKKYLRSVGERVGGRKEELVRRVAQHIGHIVENGNPQHV